MLVKTPDQSILRDAIFRLEEFTSQQPQVEIEYTHRFAPGVYTREMFVPADTLITGMIHKTEHISIFLSGRMLVPDANGDGTIITGPIVELAKPGIKRVGYVIEDVRWITVHATEETDIEVLEEMLVTNDFSEVEHLVDQQDYELMAEECGLTDHILNGYRKIPVEQMEVPGVEIRQSMRHGMGVFSTGSFVRGDFIAPAILDGELMEYSRYCNHSANPNAEMVGSLGNFNIVAIRDIENEEITVNYRRHAPFLEVQP